jgi:hypothetical protein
MSRNIIFVRKNKMTEQIVGDVIAYGNLPTGVL